MYVERVLNGKTDRGVESTELGGKKRKREKEKKIFVLMLIFEWEAIKAYLWKWNGCKMINFDLICKPVTQDWLFSITGGRRIFRFRIDKTQGSIRYHFVVWPFLWAETLTISKFVHFCNVFLFLFIFLCLKSECKLKIVWFFPNHLRTVNRDLFLTKTHPTQYALPGNLIARVEYNRICVNERRKTHTHAIQTE